jgi:hypothetical protein
LLEVGYGLDDWFAGIVSDAKAKLFAKPPHRTVLRQDIAGNPTDLLITSNSYETTEQGTAKSLPLVPAITTLAASI